MTEKHIRIPFQELRERLYRILLQYGFTNDKADRLAGIFAESSLDGVYSHGVNRFPRFISTVKAGIVRKDAEPEKKNGAGAVEQWDGHYGPGILNALFSMDRAVSIAAVSGIGCIGLSRTNHWMRGGTYGWLAAEKGYIGICFTNTKPNMVPWGGLQVRIGNNPLVVGIPRKKGHVVLDMAMSQYSFGRIQEYAMRHEMLPFPGGFDDEGKVSRDPATILRNERTIPIGFWKGSALSLVLDMLAALIAGGDSASEIDGREEEYGLSQVFIAVKPGFLGQVETDRILDSIIAYTKAAQSRDEIRYPGEKTLFIRKKNLAEGIPVDKRIWNEINEL